MPARKNNNNNIASPSRIPNAEIVRHLVGDARQPPRVALLTGFFGDADAAGHKRLYLDAHLSQFVEIPIDAIVHYQEIPAERAPLGGSYVWVRREAELIYSQSAPRQTKGKFLDGEIMVYADKLPPLPPPPAGVSGAAGEYGDGSNPKSQVKGCWGPLLLENLPSPGCDPTFACRELKISWKDWATQPMPLEFVEKPVEVEIKVKQIK